MQLPRELLEKDIIFSTQRMVPQGMVEGIRYVLFVSPEGYFSIRTQAERTKLIRAIGQLERRAQKRVLHRCRPGALGHLHPRPGRARGLWRYLQLPLVGGAFRRIGRHFA